MPCYFISVPEAPARDETIHDSNYPEFPVSSTLPGAA